MQIHVTDDRLGGYFRRYQVALRMMSHGARSQTVVEWSGLTRDQLVTQRRRWGFDPEERRRGPAPSAFHVFFASRRQQGEATLFVSLCRMLGVFPARVGEEAAAALPGIENGELLCEALEAFREWQPEAKLNIERAIQLALGVVQGVHVTLGECSDCHGALLIEGARRQYANCGRCRPARAVPAAVRSARQKGDHPVPGNGENGEGERNPDHVPEGEDCTRPRDPEEDRHADAEKEKPSTEDVDRGGEET
jgi:hypothetical protein